MVSLWRWISHKRFYVFEFLILRDIACYMVAMQPCENEVTAHYTFSKLEVRTRQVLAWHVRLLELKSILGIYMYLYLYLYLCGSSYLFVLHQKSLIPESLWLSLLVHLVKH